MVGPPAPALGELEQKEGLLGFAQFQGDFYLFLEIIPFLRIWRDLQCTAEVFLLCKSSYLLEPNNVILIASKLFVYNAEAGSKAAYF